MSEFSDLVNIIPRCGQVEWIGSSSGRREPIESLVSVELQVGTGLEGDHHARGEGTSKRQVTLIQWEHLPVIADLCGLEAVTPQMLRRNIAVSGINLLALKQRRFWIGPVHLEGTGPCAPCSRMEETLGPGGYQAVRGHGGITARVLEAGVIRVGDAVRANT